MTDKEKLENYAIIKFNSGNLAILCSCCRKIIKTGRDFTEEESAALKLDGPTLPSYYCDECKKQYQ